MKRVACLIVALSGCSRLFELQHVPDPASTDGDVSDSITSDAITEPGLIAYYTMDSISGGTLVDSVGNHNGNCANCPTVATSPKIGGALTFNGTSDVIDFPATPTLGTPGGMTVSLWLRLETTPGTTSLCAVSMVITNTNDNTWQLCADQGPVINAYYWYQGADRLLPGPAIVEDMWHHVALRWNLATLSIFIDGTQAVSATADLTFSGNILVIGADRDMGALDYPWDGTLDDLRIYNRALSDSEISALATP